MHAAVVLSSSRITFSLDPFLCLYVSAFVANEDVSK